MQLYYQAANRLSVIVTDSELTPVGSAIGETYGLLIFLAGLAVCTVIIGQNSTNGIFASIDWVSLLFWFVVSYIIAGLIVAALGVFWFFLVCTTISDILGSGFHIAAVYIVLLLLAILFLYYSLPSSTHNIVFTIVMALGMTMTPLPIARLVYHRFWMGYARRSFTFDRASKMLIVETEAFKQPKTTLDERPLSQIGSIDIYYESEMVATLYGACQVRHYIIVLKDLEKCWLLTIKDKFKSQERLVKPVAQGLSNFLQVPLAGPIELSYKQSRRLI